MLLRDAIKESHALSLMIGQLELFSGVGRSTLLNSKMECSSSKELQSTIDQIQSLYLASEQAEKKAALKNIQRQLSQIRNIGGTIKNLAAGDILDDLELFEIKHFALTVDIIRSIIEESTIQTITLPNLQPTIKILDPEALRVPRFYIYDSYSAELSKIRRELNSLKSVISSLPAEDPEYQTKEEQANQLYQQSIEIEDMIRQTLSEKLYSERVALSEALQNIAQIDILLAKMEQAKSLNLCKPLISNNEIRYKGLFNPLIQEQLKKKQKEYQPVDITLHCEPVLITGANMSGKTVLLKTLQLSQYLFQFGFFVPAAEAHLSLVDRIMVSIEDGQQEMKGLSSFAAEMLTINQMLTEVESGKRLLILIDELARTTNPTEGRAIVQAMVEMVAREAVYCVITTHYGGIKSECRRLRVKGFIESKVQGELNPQNINDYIDYSLIEEQSDSVPMDAIKVARLLGVNNTLLEHAELYICEE